MPEVSAYRHRVESDVARPLAQCANDGAPLLLPWRPRPPLTRSQHSTPERHGNMAPVPMDVLQDCTTRVV